MKEYPLKRTLDFILGLSGIFLFLPVFFLIGLAIYLEDGFPVFLFQERVGKEGKIFKGMKFRTMVRGAEDNLGPVQAQFKDTRITRVGFFLRNTALDESLQLFNILKGEMSFVGPRPLRPQEKESKDNVVRSVFDYPDFKIRCKIKPGLTGAAQVFASRNAPREDKFKYDIWYKDKQALFLDIKLIILSVLVSLKGKWEEEYKGREQRLGEEKKRSLRYVEN